MAACLPVDETVTRISKKGLHKTEGCSIDFGGSVIKLVYTRDVGDHIDLHLASFPRAQYKDAFRFLEVKIQTYKTKLSVICTTGVGCNQYKAQLKDIFDAQIENLWEMDCFIGAFRHLTDNAPIDDLVHPPSQVAKAYMENMLRQYKVTEEALSTETNSTSYVPDIDGQNNTGEKKRKIDAGQNGTDARQNETDARQNETGARQNETGARQNETDARQNEAGARQNETDARQNEADARQDEPDAIQHIDDTGTDTQNVNSPDEQLPGIEYPCMLVMCGSACVPLQVEADQTYKTMDILTVCGRSFLGLGSMLSGAKSYEELMSCAVRGHASNMDVTSKDLIANEENDLYNAISEDIVLYSYGHTINKTQDEINKDDLVASYLSSICLQLAQTNILWAMLMDVKCVYFCGSFPNHPLVRDEISKTFSVRALSNPCGKFVDHKFLKHGAYLGCIGALLVHLKKPADE